MVRALDSNPTPLALARRQALPRILERGEGYFRSGAVAQIVRRGAEAQANVAGSEDSPYEVHLAWRGGRLHSDCTCPYDWSELCKHAVALAFALEPEAVHPPALSLVETPKQVRSDQQAHDPIADAAAKEIETRAKSARSEQLRIRSGPRGLFGAYRVHSPKSQADYEVLFLSPDFAWCACADFRTSELGTCKHVEAVRAKLRGKKGGAAHAKPAAVVAAHDTRGAVHEPLGDVRLYFPGKPPPALARVLGRDGFVDPKKLGNARPEQLRRLLRRAHAVEVRPEVWALLDAEDQAQRRTERMKAFEAQVRRAASGKGAPPPAWAQLERALRVKLHPYQVDGILFAARAKRGLLADDMGLGKTFQSIAAARLLMELGEVKRALIVCPASLKRQWAKEVQKLLGDEVEARVVEGGRRDREALYRGSKAPFLILNYEILIKDLPLLRALRPEMVVLDEAQRIKNWNTKTAKAVKGLSTPHALVLTGTPMENRLGELHSVVEYLDPRMLGPMWRLGPEFAHTELQGGREKVVGFVGLDLIRRRLAPRFLRRERARVLAQLPPRTDQVAPVTFTPAQARPHNEHMQNAARIASKKHLTEADILRLMAELTNMRMLANGLLLYEWEKVEATVRAGTLPEALVEKYPSPKLAEFAGVLEQLLAQRGTKVVVFSQWERMLRLAAAAAHPVLEEAKARPLFFHGQLTSKERAEAVSDFHEDPSARVFFSTDAGGVGLNLQEAANTLVHLEVPWNPAVLEQRVGRIHRMGQTKPIQVISLISEGSIESRIAQVVEQKRALFEGLFKGDSDEVRFDDESRGTLVDRMKALLQDVAAQPSLPDQGLVARRRAVDEETRRITGEVADLAPFVPTPPAASAPPAGATAVGPERPVSGGTQVDLGAIAGGLLALLGKPAGSAAGPLPVSVRQESGKTVIELPSVPDAAWAHLQNFLAALGGR